MITVVLIIFTLIDKVVEAKAQLQLSYDLYQCLVANYHHQILQIKTNKESRRPCHCNYISLFQTFILNQLVSYHIYLILSNSILCSILYMDTVASYSIQKYKLYIQHLFSFVLFLKAFS